MLRAGGPLENEFKEFGETIACNKPELDTGWLEDVSLIYSNTCTNGAFLKSLKPDEIPVITHMHELQYAIDSFGPENFDSVCRAHSNT